MIPINEDTITSDNPVNPFDESDYRDVEYTGEVPADYDPSISNGTKEQG